MHTFDNQQSATTTLTGVERPEVYSMYLYRSNIIHRNTARFCMDAKEVDHLEKNDARGRSRLSCVLKGCVWQALLRHQPL